VSITKIEGPHPVDSTIINKYPVGLDKWFVEFSGTRSYKRVERELSTIYCNKNSKQGSKDALLKLTVYEGCFNALSWNENEAEAIIRGTDRRDFLKSRIAGFKTAANDLEKGITSFPYEFNFVGGTVLRKLKERGFEFSSKQHRPTQEHLRAFICSFNEALKEISDTPSSSSNKIMNLQAFAFPLPPAVATKYMCFYYLGGRDLSIVKRPSRETALTIYLSTIFRLYRKIESNRQTFLEASNDHRIVLFGQNSACR
jgi:hypothetical protein